MNYRAPLFCALPAEGTAKVAEDLHGWALGLDVGANSIGWMLVREVPTVEGPNVIGGVRVFPAATATEKNVEKSKTADRRVARGMRRQHDRRSRRRRRLTYVLREIGLLPPKPEPIDFVYALDPYALRARGLDEPLAPHEFARALIHLAQRRGFQSNRRLDAADSDSKRIREEVEKLRAELEKTGCRTVGEYLFRCVALPRERRRGRYMHRAMVREEFERLWEAQAPHHRELLTDDSRRKVEEVIFCQRPFLKPERLKKLVGRCAFEPEEMRARVGHRLFQRYRIAQEVANIRLIAPDGAERELTPAEKRRVREYLEEHSALRLEAGDDGVSRLHKLLGLDASVAVNYLRGGRKALKGNEAEIALRKALGGPWQELSEEMKDALNELVLEEYDEEKLIARAQQEFGLKREEAQKLAQVSLPDRFGRVSLKAIRRLLPLLEEGQSLSDALAACGYDQRRLSSRTFDILPFPPGTRFAPERERELIEQGLLLPHTTPITNPVVRKALFEVRKLVNAIIKKYGKPRRIVVELGRDTKGSIEERAAMAKRMRDREKENEKIAQTLREMGLPDPSRTDVLKHRLWEECKRTCPYSGRPITFAQLFVSGEVEVEHILPFSRSLDDSFANKTLCFRDWNQKKGDRTPREAFAESDPEAYEKMLMRVRDFQSEFRWQKLRRFLQKEVDLDSFVARQLNDTRYIAREVRSYLELLGVPVNVTRGQVTAALRRHWGLNTILSPDGSDEKKRADHRHHAIDAAVIAMTTAKHLKNLARREDFRREREPFPEPWAGWRQAVERAVESIIVSHAPTRRVRGKLHDETNYGAADLDQELFVYRKRVSELTLEMVRKKIRDRRISELLHARLDERWPEWRKKAGSEQLPANVVPENDPLVLPNRRGEPIPVKKVRLLEKLGITIGLPQAQPQRYVKPGENHHLEIFEYESKGRRRREAVVVTLFEAAQRLRRGEPVVSRHYPQRPDAQFIMSLCKNDIVRLPDGHGGYNYYRVQKFSISSRLDLSLRPHTCATLEGKALRRRKIDLQLEKVNVSVLGEVTVAHD